MGEFAGAVQDRMCEQLAERRPGFAWTTERYVGGTPVDVAGEARDGSSGSSAGDHLVAVELEWRRADPADNTAKLFRHLSAGVLDDHDRVTVVQVFTGYYDLASGGVSSKRENADFVGQVAEDALAGVRYYPVEFDLDPPKRGGEWPDGWTSAADAVAARVASLLDG